MKREFLDGLGIEKEVAEKIMAEYGKSTNALQTDLNTKTNEITTLNNQLEDYKKIDVDGFNQKINGLQTSLNEATGKYESVTKELDKYKNLEIVADAKIAPQFRKFVSQEVSQLVSEEKDFNTALNEYVEANPQYTEGEKKVISTSPSLSGNEQPKGSNEEINKSILKASGKL